MKLFLGEGQIPRLWASLVAQWQNNPHANAGDVGSVPGLERFPGKGMATHSSIDCLENSMDREAWWLLQSMGSQRVKHDLVTE